MAVVLLAAIPTGPFINGYALLPFLVLLLLWARVLTWIDKDAPACRLPRHILNAGLWGGMAIAVFLFFFVPLGLAVDLSIFGGIFVVELGVYLGLRHQKVGLSDLTLQIKEMFQTKDKREKKEKKVAAGLLGVVNKAGVPMPVPDPQTPERDQFDAMQKVLEPFKRGAERVEVTINGEFVTSNYLVDGFSYEGAKLDRNSASSAMTYLKFAAALDINEKRKPQIGPFKIVVNGAKKDMNINARGSSTSESILVTAEPKKRHAFILDSLGFTPDQFEVAKALVADRTGLVILTAPSGHGLTALEYAFIRAHDAFLQHILTIERTPEQEIEGVTQNPLPASATAQEEAKQVQWVVSQEPDVILMAEISDSNSARDLAGYTETENKRAYVGMRAGNTFDALKQWRKLVGDDTMAIRSLRLIVAGRLLRRLCENCKVGYAPDPTLLKKLNMDPAKVSKLFQARTQPMRDPKGNPIPCEKCSDMAFKGRIGVFELLVISDNIRQLLLNNASDNEIKKAFREQKGRYLQEMALEYVESGETSVNEVQRVLKPAESSGGGNPLAAPGKAVAKRR